MKAGKAEKGVFGRYRGLMLMIAIFLLSDITVVSITLYFAAESRAYVAELESVRRVRELTLELERQAAENNILQLRNFDVPEEFMSELRALLDSYDQTLEALDVGGEIPLADGSSLKLRPVRIQSSRDAIQSIQDQLQAIKTAVRELSASDSLRGTGMAYLYGYTQRFYYRSGGEVDGLVATTQGKANAAALRLRATQLVGLTIALINFIYTAFVSLRALVKNDRALGAARRETDEILDNVSDGLLLLNSDLTVGSTTSTALPAVLQRKVEPGTPFLELLREMLSPQSHQATASYLQLLVAGRVKESLVRSLNPLSEVEVRQAGSRQPRYLSFRFTRVLNGAGEFSHLLVTIQDASRTVQLANELKEASKRTRSELEVYLRLLSKDPEALGRFVAETQTKVDAINARMQAATDRGGANYAELVRHLFQDVHSIKGEAIGLGLDFFADSAHRFEDDLQVLRQRSDLGGEDFVGLAVRLDDFYQRLEVLRSIVSRLKTPGSATPSRSPADTLVDTLAEVAASAARRRNKRVRLLADLRALTHCTERQFSEIRDVLLQLVRNCVTHGIESEEERRMARKRETGTILVLAAAEGNDGSVELSVRDDGRGIDARSIRERLLASGRYSEEQLQRLDERQIVAKIFEPGFSSLDHADEDGGRGVGLDLVRSRLASLGGTAKLSSKPSHYTEISFKFTPGLSEPVVEVGMAS